ncbi:Zn-ribbon domain-containing OB-fold protein [Mycolicibacterium sp.]|uniref:Zn-ribbon domain-containing OB-fold protein n=1 Tax=Mycolicibacterium sp. TaxID=2320850 RepID=UPI003D102686
MSIANYPLADADSTPWWEALQERELRIQCCTSCHRLRWPARAVCNACGSTGCQWVSASGSGTVASWTVTHRPTGTFVVVLVRLADQDDILIPGYIDGPTDGSGLSIGMPVSLGFDDVEIGKDGWRLVVVRWRRGAD